MINTDLPNILSNLENYITDIGFKGNSSSNLTPEQVGYIKDTFNNLKSTEYFPGQLFFFACELSKNRKLSTLVHSAASFLKTENCSLSTIDKSLHFHELLSYFSDNFYLKEIHVYHLQKSYDTLSDELKKKLCDLSSNKTLALKIVLRLRKEMPDKLIADAITVAAINRHQFALREVGMNREVDINSFNSLPFGGFAKGLTCCKRMGNMSQVIDENNFCRFTENFPNIKILFIHYYMLNNIDAIGKLSSLQELNLNGNQLEKLPDEIGNLSSLKKLNLGENWLEELPDAIGNLSSLRELRLNNNELKELPDAFANLIQIETVWDSTLDPQLPLLKDIIYVRKG